MKCIYIILLSYIVNIINSDRMEEFLRIKKYELIDFDISSIDDGDIFEFTAFNNKYVIELNKNEDMIASNIIHTNGIKLSSNKSCHFFGRVLNTDDPLQRVSLSFCNNRGIRGEIRAFNKTINIIPSRYYLDIEYDNKFGQHKLNDTHIIYRYSDFDSSGIPQLKCMQIKDEDTSELTNNNNNNGRRRLITNNYVELSVISDPPHTEYYRSTYGNRWYDELYHDMADYVNQVSSKYRAVKFPDSIGTISVILRELEVIYNFDGKYKALTPKWIDSSCTDWRNDKCQIDWSYHKLMSDYVATKDQSIFDNTQIITKYRIKQGLGLGYPGVVCKKYYNTAIISNIFTISRLANAAAHEMGHNFGAHHDVDVGCPDRSGLMSGLYEGFSKCSIDAFEKYFESQDGLKCLHNTPRNFISNVNINTNKYVPIKSAVGKCLDIHDTDLYKNGGKVQIWDCNGMIQQKWYFDSSSGEIKNEGGKCLDIDYTDYINKKNGGLVQIWDCNGYDNQQWNIVGIFKEDDIVYIKNKNGACLDLRYSERNNNGGTIWIYNCGDSVNQQWTYK